MSEQEHEQEPNASLIKRVENVADLLQGSSVEEIKLTEDGTEITIKRQTGGDVPVQSQLLPSSPAEETSPKAGEDHGVVIAAPLTGVFYTSPSPGAAPFVNVGDIIQSDQIVATIEAMKVFNEVHADASGRVIQVSAENGVIVKKGDALFRVEPM